MSKRDWRAKLRYRIDEFIGGGAGKQLSFLALLTAALVLGFTALGAVLGLGVEEGFAGGPFERLTETAWFYFGRVIDAGTFVGDAGAVNRAVSTAVSVLGIVVAGLLISALAGNFQERLERIRHGGAAVMEEQHFLVLGWSEKIYSVLDQLSEAYAQRGRITCVVMAEKSKVEMEEALLDHVRHLDRMKLVVRSGSSTSLADLEKVSFAETQAIVVLIDQADVDDPDKADARVMKTLMAIFHHPAAEARRSALRVTAEVMQSENQDIALLASDGHAKVVRTNEMISKIILQTARIPGLSLVYDELLRFEGNEIHFKKFPQLTGRRFGDVLLDFPNACLVGVAKASGAGHTLNPPSDHVIGADEELLVLAEDANVAHRAYAGPLNLAMFPPSPAHAEKPVEHLLVLGWNPKVFPILKEFDDYVAQGSTVTLVNSLPEAERAALLAEHCGSLSTIQVRHLVGQFTSRALMDELSPQSYPTVMVLGDSVEAKDAESADTRAIIALLLLRDARRRSGLAPRQRVCSEILEPKNRELAATTQINDIVISNEMVSMVLAQITYEPRVQAVLEDLLRSEGSEVYLKPLERYAPPGQAVTWEYLLLAAKARGELALGLQVLEPSPEKKFGLVLNPGSRQSPITPKPGDRLVVLAEEDG